MLNVEFLEEKPKNQSKRKVNAGQARILMWICLACLAGANSRMLESGKCCGNDLVVRNEMGSVEMFAWDGV
jgi:hypothetical protein